jgi:hypothetical protein
MDRVLKREAGRAGKSLNSIVLDILRKGMGLSGETARYDDLDDLAGTWVRDPEFDRAVKEMDTIDPDLWR